jgi:UDP-N-acetylmuramyl pentapeptide phosphotransferase/UDP-N-acetylglucosamine-1-phosphate transferase
MSAALAAALALVVSSWLTRHICDPSSALHVLDHPNERSLHTHPVPRTGGVAILAGILGGIAVVAVTGELPPQPVWLALATFLIAGLSFVDDRRGLPVRVRLLGHLASGALLVAGGLSLSQAGFPGADWAWPAGFGMTVSVLYLMWMVNLYNFMDGIDGFAGGMAVIGFGTFALLGAMAGNLPFLTLNLVVAAAVAGFLVFNFPPARIFMGDTGSAGLGLLAGGLSLWGASSGVFPFWVALLVFSPFIVDASVTLVRRMLRGERVWEAHKTHYYQRLVQSGWGHRRTVLHEYVLMFACALSALLAVRLEAAGQWVLILAWCLVYAGLMAGVSRIEKKAIP